MKRMACPACEKTLLITHGERERRLLCPTCKKPLMLSAEGLAVAAEVSRQVDTSSARPASPMVPLTGPTREPPPGQIRPSPLVVTDSSPSVPGKTQRPSRVVPIAAAMGLLLASVCGLIVFIMLPSGSRPQPAIADAPSIVDPLESYGRPAAGQRRRQTAKEGPLRRGALPATPQAGRGSNQSEASKIPQSHEDNDPVQAVLRSVAVVAVPGEGHGSGFVAAPGVLVTNHHVIEGAIISDLQISFPDNDAVAGRPLRAALMHVSLSEDLAFLAIDADVEPLGIKAVYEHVNGQRVVAIGSPGSGGDGPTLENLTTDGRLGPELKLDDEGKRWALSMAVNGGNSGGPLVDAQSGEVIGVIVAKFTKTEAQSLAIPHAALTRELARACQSSQDARAAALSLHRQRYCLRLMARILGMTSVAFNRSIDAAIDHSKNGDADAAFTAFNECKALAAAAFNDHFADFSGAVGGEVQDLQDDPHCDPRVRRGLHKLLSAIEEQADEIRRRVPSDEIETFLGKFKGSVEASRALVASLAERLQMNHPETAEDD
jgi:S1-C subfamily serine protease